MAFCMSVFISFILVSINWGDNSVFLATWLKVWSQAFVCALFGAYFFPVLIQKNIMSKINFVEKPVKKEGDHLGSEPTKNKPTVENEI
jgi:hypothetical protein